FRASRHRRTRLATFRGRLARAGSSRREPLMSRSFALAALVLLLAEPATAQMIVYRGSGSCATNSTPGAIPIGGGPTNVLVCFDDPGGGTPTPGQECVGGTADEVCGVDVEIRTTGAVSILGFTPVGDWVFSNTFPTTLFKANGGNPLTGDAVP